MLPLIKSIFIFSVVCCFIKQKALAMTYEEVTKKIPEFRNECINEFKNLSKEEVHNIFVKKLQPANRDGYCLVSCFYQKVHFLAPNNTILADRMKEHITVLNPKGGDEYERKLKVIDACKKKEVTPIPTVLCDAGLHLKDCFLAEKVNFNVTTALW